MAYRRRSTTRRRTARTAPRRRVSVSRRRVATRSTRRAAPRRAQTVRVVVQSGAPASAAPLMLSSMGTMLTPQTGKARF